MYFRVHERNFAHGYATLDFILNDSNIEVEVYFFFHTVNISRYFNSNVKKVLIFVYIYYLPNIQVVLL